MKAEEFGWEGGEAASASTGLCWQSQHTEQHFREQVPGLCAMVAVSALKLTDVGMSQGPHGEPRMMPKSRNTRMHLGLGWCLLKLLEGDEGPDLVPGAGSLGGCLSPRRNLLVPAPPLSALCKGHLCLRTERAQAGSVG